MAYSIARTLNPGRRVSLNGTHGHTASVARSIGWIALPWLVPVACAVLWVLGSHYGRISPQILPSSILVFDTLGGLASSGELWMHISASLSRIAVGFTGGVVLGLLLGAWLGLSRTAEAYILPSFNAVVQVSVLGWLPFLMIVVGIGEPLKYLLIGYAALVPVTLSTLQGFRRTPPAYLDVARVFRYSRRQTIFNVILPSAVPVIGTGIRTCVYQGVAHVGRGRTGGIVGRARLPDRVRTAAIPARSRACVGADRRCDRVCDRPLADCSRIQAVARLA